MIANAGSQPSIRILRSRPAGALKATPIEYSRVQKMTTPDRKNGDMSGLAMTSEGVGPTSANGSDHQRLFRSVAVVSTWIHVRVVSELIVKYPLALGRTSPVM